MRVTGYLMLDTEHLNDSEPKRYTYWGIHPITAFEVCTGTRTRCDAGEAWRNLEEWVE